LPAFAQELELSTDHPKDYVSAVLPYKIDVVYDRIKNQFSSSERAFFEDYNGMIYKLPGKARTLYDLSPKEQEKFISFPLVHNDKFYVFFGAYRNMQHILQEITTDSLVGITNPALERYSKLSPLEREKDIYLWSPDTPFWYSEYNIDKKPLPFRTYFIIHLTAVDDTHTSVEVIEKDPVISAGKKLSVDSNGVVHRFDIRDVAPTTKDREYLLYCINQFIERQIPSRHVFNCLSQDTLKEVKKKEIEHREIEEEVKKQMGTR
jgi:hypothetical protein